MSTSQKSGGCKTCELSNEGDVCGSFIFQPDIDNPEEVGDVDLGKNSIDNFVNNMKGSSGNSFKSNQQSQDAKEQAKTEIENELREALYEALEERDIKPKPNTKYNICTEIKATATIHSGSNCGHGPDVKVSHENPEFV